MVALENEADIFPVQLRTLLPVKLVYRVFEQVIFPCPTVIQHADDAHQRGLARSRGPHDRDELTFPNVQVDAAQNIDDSGAGFVSAFDIAELNHFFTSRSCTPTE